MSMPPVQDDPPDAGHADAVFTVVSLRAVVLSGLAAGALVLCFPLVLLGCIGHIATFLFNRGTIYAGVSFTSASGKIETAGRVTASALAALEVKSAKCMSGSPISFPTAAGVTIAGSSKR